MFMHKSYAFDQSQMENIPYKLFYEQIGIFPCLVLHENTRSHPLPPLHSPQQRSR